jgi:hypothetical protein
MHGKVVPRLLTAIALLSSALSCSAECLRYGVVSLTGRLVQQTYPGPPDFESVTKGDELRIIWILQLDRGVCADGYDSSYSSAYNEREIQLVLGTDQYAQTNDYAPYRHLLGQRIAVTGRLLPGGATYEKRLVIALDAIEKARD